MSTRAAAVAGMFYPAGKEKLGSVVDSFLKNTPHQSFDGKLRALIVPHAGYEYSGQVAAYGYSLLRHKPEIILLLGPSHYTYFSGIAADANTQWETPLGKIDVLQSSFTKIVEAHRQEHCLEVQLPFLQRVLPRFEILPLVMGDAEPEEAAKEVGKALRNSFLIISSDLSHYHSFEAAARLDRQSCAAVEKLDYKAAQAMEACGKLPILTAIKLAQAMNWKCRLLKYANSGDATGDTTRVVGYASFALYE